MLHFKGDKLIDFSLKLSKMHRSALPNAVRFSLTDAAKDVKFKTLSKHANKEFDVKKASFFRAFSRFKPAQGWNISAMQSTAGMVKGTPKNSKSVASTEIGKQQFAGIVPNRAYIGAKEQRTSKGLLKSSYAKLLSIKPVVFNGDNYFEKAIEAKKAKKPLLVKKNNRGVLVKVKKIKKKKAKPIETEPIASYEKGRKADLKTKHPFVINAGLESARKMNSFYIKNARKQIERLR